MENMEIIYEKKFWRNKKILLTGFNGFKGSWMTLMLSRLGAKVYGYSLKDKNGIKNNKIFKLEKECEGICYGNILNYSKLNNFIKKIKPNIVIHMASQSLVKESYANPLKTFRTNSEGLANILNIILTNNKKITTFVLTSDKCYQNKNKKKNFSENDKLLGDDPYSASKSIQEIISNSYLKSFNLKIATARAGNVIGGGDMSNNRIIPDIIKSIYNKKKLIIRDINSTRPWQHVLDINLNYIKFIEKFFNNKKLSGPWNFGPNQSYKVKEILKFFKKRKKFNFNLSKKNFREKKELRLSSQKLKKELGLKNNISFINSLIMTLAWYEKFYKKDNQIYRYTINEIDKFLAKYY